MWSKEASFKNFHQHSLQWLRHRPQHNFGWYFPQLNSFCRCLEVSSAGKWVNHESGHEREKQKRCWIGYLKAVIRMLMLRSAEPRQPSHRVFMLSASAVIRLLHLAPVSSGSWQQRCSPYSTHSYIWLALTWSPWWRSIQPLPRKMLVKRM